MYYKYIIINFEYVQPETGQFLGTFKAFSHDKTLLTPKVNFWLFDYSLGLGRNSKFWNEQVKYNKAKQLTHITVFDMQNILN